MSVKELAKSISKKFIDIPFSIQFITVYCKDLKTLQPKKEITFQKSSSV